MKYTKEKRIDIGRQVYTHELSRADAMAKYGVNSASIDTYVRMYKIASGIPVKSQKNKTEPSVRKPKRSAGNLDIEAYQSMTREELINELILAKANELRAKKGYEVKGVGANKEFISLSSKNSKS